MGRKPLHRQSIFPYHVTARSNNREWFAVKAEEAWSIFNTTLFVTAKIFNLRIHGFVMMSNHIHLLVTTPESNLDEAMQYFLRESAKEINGDSGRINHVFGSRYHWSLVSNALYYSHVLKYLYQNPMRADLVTECEYYPYSTIAGLWGRKRLLVPIHRPGFGIDALIPTNPIEMLQWLNTPARDPREVLVVKRGLKSAVFKPAPSRVKRWKLSLEEMPL